MELIDVLRWVCVLFSWACEPPCEAECASYRGACGDERVYDCEDFCEAGDDRRDLECASCWSCLDAASCVETAPGQACWAECNACMSLRAPNACVAGVHDCKSDVPVAWQCPTPPTLPIGCTATDNEFCCPVGIEP